MAIIDPRLVTRFPIPHEPGEWVELRRLSGGQLRRLARTRSDNVDGFVLEGLRQAMVAWSYPVPITAESLDQLDNQTLVWLMNISGSHTTGTLSDDDRKDAMSRLIDSSPESGTSIETLPTIS